MVRLGGTLGASAHRISDAVGSMKNKAEIFLLSVTTPDMLESNVHRWERD